MATNRSTRYIAYKPSTTYRDILRPEEKVHWPVCSTWFEELIVPHAAFGSHVTIPGRPAEGAAPQETWDQVGRERFLVKAVNNRYGFALCPAGLEREDLGQVHTLALLSLTSKRIALDVIGLSVPGISDEPDADGVRRMMTPGVLESDLTKKGFFVPEDVVPTDAEIDIAEEKRQNYLIATVQKADTAWNNSGGKADNIHPDAIKAARWLGQARPWAPEWSAAKKQAAKSQPCPLCLSPVVTPQRICLVCGKIMAYDQDGAIYWKDDPDIKAARVAAAIGAGA